MRIIFVLCCFIVVAALSVVYAQLLPFVVAIIASMATGFLLGLITGYVLDLIEDETD